MNPDSKSQNKKHVRFSDANVSNNTEILDMLLVGSTPLKELQENQDSKDITFVSPIDLRKMNSASEKGNGLYSNSNVQTQSDVKPEDWRSNFAENSNRILREYQRQLQELLHYKQSYEAEVLRSTELQDQIYSLSEKAEQTHFSMEKKCKRLSAELEETKEALTVKEQALSAAKEGLNFYKDKNRHLQEIIDLKEACLSAQTAKERKQQNELEKENFLLRNAESAAQLLQQKLEDSAKEMVKLESKNLKLEAQLFEAQRKLAKFRLQEKQNNSFESMDGERTSVEISSQILSFPELDDVQVPLEHIKSVQEYFLKLRVGLSEKEEKLGKATIKKHELEQRIHELEEIINGLKDENEYLSNEMSTSAVARQKDKIESETAYENLLKEKNVLQEILDSYEKKDTELKLAYETKQHDFFESANALIKKCFSLTSSAAGVDMDGDIEGVVQAADNSEHSLKHDSKLHNCQDDELRILLKKLKYLFKAMGVFTVFLESQKESLCEAERKIDSLNTENEVLSRQLQNLKENAEEQDKKKRSNDMDPIILADMDSLRLLMLKQKDYLGKGLREYCPKTKKIDQPQVTHVQEDCSVKPEFLCVMENNNADLLQLLSFFRQYAQTLSKKISKLSTQCTEFKVKLDDKEKLCIKLEGNLSEEGKKVRLMQQKLRSNTTALEGKLTEENQKVTEKLKQTESDLKKTKTEKITLENRIKQQNKRLKQLTDEITELVADKLVLVQNLKTAEQDLLQCKETVQIELLRKISEKESSLQQHEKIMQREARLREMLYQVIKMLLTFNLQTLISNNELRFQRRIVREQCSRLESEFMKIEDLLEQHVPMSRPSRAVESPQILGTQTKEWSVSLLRRWRGACWVIVACRRLRNAGSLFTACGVFDTASTKINAKVEPLSSVVPLDCLKEISNVKSKEENCLWFPSVEDFLIAVESSINRDTSVNVKAELVLRVLLQNIKVNLPENTLLPLNFTSSVKPLGRRFNHALEQVLIYRTPRRKRSRPSLRGEGLYSSVENILANYTDSITQMEQLLAESEGCVAQVQTQNEHLNSALKYQQSNHASIEEDISRLESQLGQRPSTAELMDLRRQLVDSYASLSSERNLRCALEEELSSLKEQYVAQASAQNNLINEIQALNIEVQLKNCREISLPNHEQTKRDSDSFAMDSKSLTRSDRVTPGVASDYPVLTLYEPCTVNVGQRKKPEAETQDSRLKFIGDTTSLEKENISR